MRWVTSCAIGLTLLCPAAGAETPEQVFQRASASVVVVHVSDASGEPVALGSGIVSSPGTVITNCHVAQAGPQLKASHLGKSFAATLQYADTDRDLCQLSVPMLDAPPVSLGDSKNLKVGQRVYAVGAPMVSADRSKILAFSCSGPVREMTRKRLISDLGPKIMQLRDRVYDALGGVF